MSTNRQRWTKARYYKAQHLDRLLCQLGSVVSPPAIVQKLHELVQHTPGMHGVDPLTRPLRDRHWDRFGDPDIPF